LVNSQCLEVEELQTETYNPELTSSKTE